MNYFGKTYNTIFLDRDGVINKRPLNDYVKSWTQFEFLPGVLNAFSILSYHFKRIIIVTNQQGIGKGIMTNDELSLIHQKMLREIQNRGGRVDAIYYCPDLASKSNGCRKPGIKMAEFAKNDFSEIDFKKSIMVGDTRPDMQFGRNAGMTTVYIGIESPLDFISLVDYKFANLDGFASSLVAND